MTNEMLQSSSEFILNSHVKYARDTFCFRKQPQGGGTPVVSVLRAATAVKVGQDVDRPIFHVDR